MTSPLKRQIHTIGRRRALAIWAVALTAYILAVFHRTSLGVAGLLAAERFDSDAAHIERLWSLARDMLPEWTINGANDARYHGNLNIRREGLDGARLISELRDVAFSLGSACASCSCRPSHVLRALGLSAG